jgi:hypothetical protein
MRSKSQAPSRFRPLKAGVAAAAAAAAVVASTATPAFAASYSLSTTQIAIAGGTILRLYGGSAFADTQGIRFVPTASSCPATYDAALTGAVNGGLIDADGGTVATVLTPAVSSGTVYKPCLYADATTGAVDNTDTTVDTLTPVNMGALSTHTGKATDKITLTARSGIFTAATYSTQFVSGVAACPATYTTASATHIVGVTAKTSTTVLTITVPTLVVGTSYLVCNYGGTSAGTSPLAARGSASFAVYDPTLPAAVLNPTGGSSGTSPTVTVTLPSASTAFAGTPDVLVSRNSCPNTRPASLTAVAPYQASMTKISNYKIAVTMPDEVIVAGGDVTTPWNVCAYADSSTGAALVMAPAAYNVAPVLSVAGTLLAVGSGSAASTGSGPAQGGSVLTISGLTGIPTADGALLNASLGGSPINITSTTSTSITGTTTAHAAGAVNLSVTTAAGTKSTVNTPYTYTYGITVTPNTAASASTPILDITGAGFGSLAFGNVSTGVGLSVSTAYVLLTDNAWNARDFSTDKAAVDTGAGTPVSYCNNVLPISDGEIICTLNLTARVDSATTDTPTITTVDVPDGTYTVTVVNAKDGLNEADYNYSVVSSGSTFTVASF